MEGFFEIERKNTIGEISEEMLISISDLEITKGNEIRKKLISSFKKNKIKISDELDGDFFMIGFLLKDHLNENLTICKIDEIEQEYSDYYFQVGILTYCIKFKVNFLGEEINGIFFILKLEAISDDFIRLEDGFSLIAWYLEKKVL